MASACRFQVELWLFIVVLEDDESNTGKAACLILRSVAGVGWPGASITLRATFLEHLL